MGLGFLFLAYRSKVKVTVQAYDTELCSCLIEHGLLVSEIIQTNTHCEPVIISLASILVAHVLV